MTIFCYAENFPESTSRAVHAVRRFRENRHEPVPATMADWQVEDHLIAFSFRIKPLKDGMSALLDAGIHVFHSLWPDALLPAGPIPLADALMNAGFRLAEWRYSAGRAAVDEALSHMLSWYEAIDFDVVQTCRTNSKYIAEEEWVQRRKQLANYYTERASVHSFIPGLPFLKGMEPEAEEGAEEEVDGDDGSEAEASGEMDVDTEAADAAEAASRDAGAPPGSGKDAEADAPPS